MKIKIELEDEEVEFVNALIIVAGTDNLPKITDGVMEIDKPIRDLMGGGQTAVSMIRGVEFQTAE